MTTLWLILKYVANAVAQGVIYNTASVVAKKAKDKLKTKRGEDEEET